MLRAHLMLFVLRVEGAFGIFIRRVEDPCRVWLLAHFPWAFWAKLREVEGGWGEEAVEGREEEAAEEDAAEEDEAKEDEAEGEAEEAAAAEVGAEEDA